MLEGVAQVVKTWGVHYTDFLCGERLIFSND